MIDPILTVRHLQTEFLTRHESVRAIDDISFSVNKGEIFALVGESGSGKTITALSILRLLPPNTRFGAQSEILFDNQNLITVPEIHMRNIRGRKIAMIFQEPMTALNPVLTVGYQLAEVLKQHTDLSGRRIKVKAKHLLEQVGLPDPKRFLLAYPHELSGGQRQRVAIAMALAGEPDLLIADEPTTALDVTIQAQILDLLADLQRTRQMAMLLITHDLGVVAKIAQSVAVMHEGKIVEQAPVDQFFAHPQHPYSQALFAAIPKRQQRSKKETSVILTAKDLHVDFRQKDHWWEHRQMMHAVDGVSFTLHAGKTLALVGESGSGKTTLAKALLRLISLDKGEITLGDALSLNKLSMKAQSEWLQIVWQDPYSSLNPRMSVRDIIAEGLAVQGKHAVKDKTIMDLLQRVELPASSIDHYPHQFSGGQRQRIAIARALAARPKIVICDEPTSALDVSVQAQVLNLLQELQTEFNLAYVLITHNMSVVEFLADEIAVMQHGRIVEQGPANQILDNPQHAYTQLLLSAVLHVKK